MKNPINEIRRLFKMTKFGGSVQQLPDSWWNWERKTFSPDDLVADPFKALGFSPVARAIQVVSNDIARVPIRMERKTDAHWEVVDDNPVMDEILNEIPNTHFSAYEFRGWMCRSMMLWGNAFALISRWGNEVRELIPVRPWDMALLPDTERGGWYYHSSEYGDIKHTDVLHFRMPSYQRMLWGESPIILGRHAVALGQEQEAAGRSAFQMPGLGKIAITTKETMGGEAVRRMQEAFRGAHSGPEGMLRPIVVQNESDVKQVGQSLTDQDWIAARKFSINQVAQMYGVPPQMLYNLESESASGVAEQARQYVDNCLSQYTSTWAAELAWKLLPHMPDGDRYRFVFDTTQLVRGTFAEQVSALQIAVQTGVMTRNEARTMMGFNPIEGGDEVLIGPNMLPIEQNQQQAAGAEDAGDAGESADE